MNEFVQFHPFEHNYVQLNLDDLNILNFYKGCISFNNSLNNLLKRTLFVISYKDQWWIHHSIINNYGMLKHCSRIIIVWSLYSDKYTELSSVLLITKRDIEFFKSINRSIQSLNLN